MILAGLEGPVFLVTSNFDVIKAYNNSTAYALSVALLGDAVKGGGRLRGASGRPTTSSPPKLKSGELQAKAQEDGL